MSQTMKSPGPRCPVEDDEHTNLCTCYDTLAICQVNSGFCPQCTVVGLLGRQFHAELAFRVLISCLFGERDNQLNAQSDDPIHLWHDNPESLNRFGGIWDISNGLLTFENSISLYFAVQIWFLESESFPRILVILNKQINLVNHYKIQNLFTFFKLLKSSFTKVYFGPTSVILIENTWNTAPKTFPAHNWTMPRGYIYNIVPETNLSLLYLAIERFQLWNLLRDSVPFSLALD